jgi:hypothetical protein
VSISKSKSIVRFDHMTWKINAPIWMKTGKENPFAPTAEARGSPARRRIDRTASFAEQDGGTDGRE